SRASGRAQAEPSYRSWPDILVASATQVPQASSVIEVDLSHVVRRLDDSREAWLQRGIQQPGFTPFLAAALLAALRGLPQANASFDADVLGIRRYSAVHLGLSLASQDGSHACYGLV